MRRSTLLRPLAYLVCRHCGELHARCTRCPCQELRLPWGLRLLVWLVLGVCSGVVWWGVWVLGAWVAGLLGGR